jgi:hypothetical protein
VHNWPVGGATSLPYPEGKANMPAKSAFEFPSNDSGGRDTVAMERFEGSHPLKVGVIRYHRFDHESGCRIYSGGPCDCAVIMWVIDVPLSQFETVQDVLAQVFLRPSR